MIPFTQHVARGLSRLGSRWRTKPKFVALVRILLEEVQELSDAQRALDFYRSLGNAVGATLDQWGKRLNLDRNGLGDDGYRLRLMVRLLVLRSSGKADQLIHIFRLLAPEPDWLVRWTARYPAAQEIRVSGEGLPSGDDFAQILQDAKAGGVQSTFRWSSEADADTFSTLGGGGLGLSTLADPTAGGRLSRAKG